MVAVANLNTPRKHVLEGPQPLNKLNNRSRRNTSDQNSARRESESVVSEEGHFIYSFGR
jgi:hypothetical protein